MVVGARPVILPDASHRVPCDDGAVSSPGPGESTRIRSLVLTTVVLVVAVLAVTGLTRACSFSPTAPYLDRSTVRRIDPAAALRDAAAGAAFPLRVPATPPGWIPQSSDVAPVGAGRAVRVGWVTPADHFARLVQSDAGEAALAASQEGDPAARGTVDAGGRAWVVHTGPRGEAMWVTDLGPVRLLVTGDAPPDELTVLATAALAGTPAR